MHSGICRVLPHQHRSAGEGIETLTAESSVVSDEWATSPKPNTGQIRSCECTFQLF